MGRKAHSAYVYSLFMKREDTMISKLDKHLNKEPVRRVRRLKDAVRVSDGVIRLAR
jgi:hypothetical protein